jgi:putative ATPase
MAMDLFDHQREKQLQRQAPLAERLRPQRLDDFIGQGDILGPGRLLRRAIAADRLGSLIFHGPPGTGKTTLARIIANSTRCHFSSLNAVLAGIKELRTEIEQARERLGRHGLRSLLFIDEVHRFNTAQQDALLPWVENGTVTLIGATTENPFFEVNKALVSRSRLFRLQPLGHKELQQVLDRALSDREQGYGCLEVVMEPAARQHLVSVAGGDARTLLNALELAVDTTPANGEGLIVIDLAVAEQSIQQQAVLYDKQGDAHFDTISAFIKSIRGSDPDAVLFWLARMVEAGEDPRFIFRRLLIAAGEDIGLADPQGIVVVQACAAAFDRIGLPEGLYPLVQASLYLAGTSKSNSALGFFDAVRSLREERAQQVPAHLRDAHRDGSAFGDGVGYRYPHAYAEHWVAQQYLPTALQGQIFWQPGKQGWEGQRRSQLQLQRAAQLSAAAESASEQGEPLSSGPGDASLERWLKRQMAQEGERLQALQQRFWAPIRLARHHRVLALGCRSLLWVLPALAGTPEGGVVLQVNEGADAERLAAQLQVLDQLGSPELRLAPNADLQSLRLGLATNHRFELIIGRNVLQGASPSEIQAWGEDLAELLADRGQLELLFSRPLGGPAQLLRQATGQSWPFSAELEQMEQEWLRSTMAWELLDSSLEAAGWQIQRQEWTETLQLPVDQTLLQRWFGSEATYRPLLESRWPAEVLQTLEQAFGARLGSQLPQTLHHQRLSARLGAETSDHQRPRTPSIR